MNDFYRLSNLRLILLVFCCLSIAILGCNLTGILSPESQSTSEQSSGVEVSESPEGLLPIPTEKPMMAAIPTSTPLSIPAETETSLQLTALPDIPPEIASQLDKIELQVIELRELQPIGFVSRSLLTRDQLRQKIENEFFEDYTEEEARDDSIVQSAFGLLQPGFDMFNFYKEFLNEQIAGIYDRETKVMDVIQGSVFGDLNGQGSCVTPQRIPAGGSYTCSLSTFVDSNMEAMYTNVVTARGIDDSGNPVSASNDATFSITDVPSSIEVVKTVTPSTVDELGETVTFTFTVNNISLENSVTITSLTDNIFGGTERLTYAHEYTHALQDQNYDIENGLEYNDESCEEDSERCAAVQALIEGDASFSELIWLANYATMEDIQDIQEFYSNYEGAIYNSAPDFLQEDFLFPYLYGQAFVEYLYNLGGWEAVNKAYNNLPVSTEQILHPERYPADRPVQVDIPDLSSILGEGWRELDKGILGEWYTFLVLAHGIDPQARLSETEAQSASDGWGGDVYVVYYNKQEDQVVLVLHTSWETTNDANQFLNAFQAHSTSRFGSPSIVRQDYVGWNHAGGYSDIHMQDRFTTWIVSPDQDISQTVWEFINRE